MKSKILVAATLYKAEIEREFQKRFYTDDMLFETGSLNNWIPNISVAPDGETYEFAIVDNNKLIGYLSYYINWYSSCAAQFGLMSFDKGNPVIGLALRQTMNKLLYDYKLHRIEFRMVGGNPVERHYDKFCKRFGGTKHVLKDAIKDRYGNYHDDVIYEIINKEV